jgi:sugar O-acyltransferase (sialic acid O-acetyltransferase NeuD family)
MIKPVVIPTVNANDENALFLKWHVADGTFVKRGQLLCDVETTKAAVAVEAEQDGYLVTIAEEGKRYDLGAMIGLLKSEPGEDAEAVLAQLRGEAETGGTEQRRWTKKAFIVARRLDLDIEALSRQFPGKVLGEEDVLAAQKRASATVGELSPLVPLDPSLERLILIGGGAGAGILALDALARNTRQVAVGILDGNPKTHGQSVRGVPVLGSMDRIQSLWEQKAFDAAVILFTDDVKDREAVFQRLSSAGIAFANLIDTSVEMRSGVTLGRGNVIMANCYFAVDVVVGDNNFFASGTAVEHHSVIGSHCTFGPRCSMSGRVTVDDKVKFGMNVAVEPYVKIGERSIVASGVVLTASVPANAIAKATQTHTIRPRD